MAIAFDLPTGWIGSAALTHFLSWVSVFTCRRTVKPRRRHLGQCPARIVAMVLLISAFSTTTVCRT